MAVTPGSSRFQTLAAVLLAGIAILLVMAPSAMARGMKLSASEARSLAAKTAEQVRQDLESEGASKAGVAGCWRNSARRVSCYLKVTGYDAELEFRWTCMLRMVVELQPTPSGRARLKSRYGTAACG